MTDVQGSLGSCELGRNSAYCECAKLCIYTCTAFCSLPCVIYLCVYTSLWCYVHVLELSTSVWSELMHCSARSTSGVFWNNAAETWVDVDTSSVSQVLI